MLILIIYLSIGVFMNIIGPLAKKVNDDIKSVKKHSAEDLLIEKYPVPLWKKILYEIIWRLLIILFYPLLYLIICIDYFQIKNQKKAPVELYKDDNLLYFDKMGGWGVVYCNNCNYNQEIISFQHGTGPNSWNNSGFQCQKCGKFHEIECDMSNSNGKLCECGGILSNKLYLFCPICKTANIRYMMRYIS